MKILLYCIHTHESINRNRIFDLKIAEWAGGAIKSVRKQFQNATKDAADGKRRVNESRLTGKPAGKPPQENELN